ncbi:flagellar biosynthetic protein FliR [Paramaledivibacter caminithermalis]|jgi:flagellar biosynthetic protein FliR|uniref:Flagellar biosynthetic protein FliR n=1 Tax=Paramaledivibacter caminithermalis (strain DSM 15212 / CIP 107654 / DViRD3) TaxID=1121301 RepID=A0A1M6N703_PARC5|nr:flagellar biosynthetic protein FliR [Paramaledivibacter caminithermalis]SHJ91432.1 flagellar biosynthetic protein FliR [Paramaledivibacter caminithermalis DSM 15212]
MNIMENIIILILVFSRISGIFLLTPVFGTKTIPRTLKIGIAGFLTLIAFPIITISSKLQIIHVYQLLYYMLIEFLIGLVFGFISLLILNSIYIAGVLVDRNIGFSIVSVISPQDESQIPITANFYYVMCILVFLMTDLHHTLIKAVLHSFKIIPIGYETVKLLFVDKVIEILETSFILGFKIAVPVMITIFITNVILGILSRAIPQMNVFVVGMPLKIFIGLVTIFIVLPLYFKVFSNIFAIMFDYIKEFLNSAVKG